ncbi:MAG TPA: hypothetical protein VN626_06940 [Clostridia bacterium]|nr:hypothetical protein [Clostridia bacterium]
MKKFSFPLESVLRYKGSLLEEEKNKLNILRSELNRIEDSMAENSRQLLANDQELKALAKKGCGIAALCCISFQIDNTRQLLEDLKTSRAKQALLVEKQLAVVVEVKQSVSGMERLREKHLESYREAQLKEDELTIGELVSTKYARAGHSQ